MSTSLRLSLTLRRSLARLAPAAAAASTAAVELRPNSRCFLSPAHLPSSLRAVALSLSSPISVFSRSMATAAEPGATEARVQASRSEGRAVPDLSAELRYSNRDSVVAVIMDEHRRVEMLYQAFCESKDPDDRMILVYNMIKMLSQHAGCEELVLYPALRDRLPNGPQLFDRSVAEHGQLKRDLAKLDGLTWKDAEFEPTVHKAMEDQTAHVREEEKETLPLLARHCQPADLKRLADDFFAAKAIAPTRPHPDAPVGSVAAYAAARALDAVKDAVRFSGLTRPSREETTADAAAAAGAADKDADKRQQATEAHRSSGSRPAL